MLDTATLEAAVLEFRHKSFSFERAATVDGVEYAVFARRETETESKLRPKVIRLVVVVPRDRLVYEEETGSLWISPDGVLPGPREGGSAQEAAAEAPEFREQGLEFRRRPVAGGVAYLPKVRSDKLGSGAAAAALGLGAG